MHNTQVLLLDSTIGGLHDVQVVAVCIHVWQLALHFVQLDEGDDEANVPGEHMSQLVLDEQPWHPGIN